MLSKRACQFWYESKVDSIEPVSPNGQCFMLCAQKVDVSESLPVSHQLYAKYCSSHKQGLKAHYCKCTIVKAPHLC